MRELLAGGSVLLREVVEGSTASDSDKGDRAGDLKEPLPDGCLDGRGLDMGDVRKQARLWATDGGGREESWDRL